MDRFPHLKKTFKGLAFSRTPLKQGLSNLYDYNIAWGLHCHSRFDDLDFVSSLQVTGVSEYQLQIACF